MKIDRKKIINRCGYDHVECCQLAQHLSECPDDQLIPEIKKIHVWNYGKCELGLWADVLDRLDGILERAATKVGKWMLRLDLPENKTLVEDVVAILEFTGHLIEHSIYRYLYGSWNHILALFGSENMDILLAVLGLSYNFSKRSNYFVRLDPANKKVVLDRLVSIAETWGGTENNFGLAACCDPNHFPETAGNVYFEYVPAPADTNVGPVVANIEGEGNWSSTEKIVLTALHTRNQSPAQIMEDLLSQHPVPASKQMALFARIRLAAYFSNPEQRQKCIRARLQALSILAYTFEVDERNVYPSLLDELVDVLELPADDYIGIKACALRTMTAIVNSHRIGVNWTSLIVSTGLSTYHGTLPSLTRRWIQGLVNGTIDAPGGSTNQQFTTALLSFLYHLACYEENVGSGSNRSTILNASGILDTMLQLIAWRTSRSDFLSYVTRAVRVTDQILMTATVNRQNVLTMLIDRLKYEVDLVLSETVDNKVPSEHSPALNTQRSGLMKSLLNLVKRLCLDAEWSEVMHSAMESNLPEILRCIFLTGSSHFTPHLALLAMECITNYVYTYPSRLSAMQDNGVTADILTAITSQPLPRNRDFLVQLPSLFNTLALNARGVEAIQQSGVLTQYLQTLISPDYLPTMKTKRVRDFLSQVSYNLTSTAGQNPSNSLTANQMSAAVQELLRSHSGLKSVVFQGLITCMQRVVELGNVAPANLITEMAQRAELAASSSTIGGPSSTSVPQSTFPPGIPGDSSGSLTEDVTMLSGGEEDAEDDLEFSRATQTSSAGIQTARATAIVLDSRSTSPTPPLSFREGTLTSDQLGPPLLDGIQLPAHFYLSDFLLNTCKFLEKLLPSHLHVTETMCRQFMGHGGIHVLCDFLRMPGLPYDFPVSAACASMCKIFEDLANSLYLDDVLDPLLECLNSSLERLTALQSGDQQMSSVLLQEYMNSEHLLLHELVVVASTICILVQVIDHLRPEPRPSLANKLIGHSAFRTLGQLHVGVSWEAALLLRMLSGDKNIMECDSTGIEKMSDAKVIPTKVRGKVGSEQSCPGLLSADSAPVPQFVEALHIYTLLKPLKVQPDLNRNAFLQRRSDLIKVTHRMLHVTAFFINSFTELCMAWGRFFTGRNQTSYRRRRTTLLASEQLSNATRYAAFSQISQVLVNFVSWKPPPSIKSHPSGAPLVYAMRYSAVRLVNDLLYDSSRKVTQRGMSQAFFMLNGMQRFFGLFRELISYDLTDPMIKEPLAHVLEDWLVCADRISNSDSGSNDVNRTNEFDLTLFEPEKYYESIHQNMLFPLEQICTRDDLQSLLTRRAVEHLIGMLVTIVPYLFNVERKAPGTSAESDVSALPSGTDTPKEATIDSQFCLETPSFSATQVADRTTIIQTTPMDVSVPIAEPSSATTQASNLSTILSRVVDSTLEHVTDDQQPQPMDVTPSLPGASSTDTSSALQLLEEMGFSREVATIALDQTGWNTNEAVNLLIATPEQDLLASAVERAAVPSFDWTGSTLGVSQPNESISGIQRGAAARSASTIAAAAARFANSGTSLPGSTITSIPAARMTRTGMSGLESLPFAMPGSLSPPFNTETLSAEVIAELRESLKQHVFRACYKIAKRRNSDQILHRIAELLLSSGEQERYINELFGFVASNVSERLSSMPSNSSTTPADPPDEHPIVGLHLAALLFTRCQALCARLASSHKLPDLLISWIACPDLASHLCERSSESSSSRSNKPPMNDYYKTLMLACLILDQYERSIRAMHLRRLSTKRYVNCHSWNWLDDRAMLWHPYATDSRRTIDSAFHKGDLYASCHISRRPYAVEFPTMSQVNLDSLHRRPVLLFPRTEEDTDDGTPTAYESAILNAETPANISRDQCRTLIHALFSLLRNAAQLSSLQASLPSDCLNAVLRLLLRLVYSSYESADDLIHENFISVLFKNPHSREFTSEYSTFVGSIFMQVFDEMSTVRHVMEDVLRKVCRFGAPSTFLGIDTGSSACRDLFYVLSLCSPMFAKDYEMARNLALDTMSLSLSDADVGAKTLPKNYIVELSEKERSTPSTEFVLSDRQKDLLSTLIHLIMHSDGAHPNVACGSVGSGRSVAQSSRDALLPESKDPHSIRPPAAEQPACVCLGKSDAIRILLELISSYRVVAEYVALYQEHQPSSSETKSTTSRAFLSHMFNTQLNEQETIELSTSLLENLMLMTAESTQDVMIAEFKASLGRLSNSLELKPSDDSSCLRRNDRISAHMHFLKRLLALPSPLVDRIVRLIYRRSIPADIAKLIALVDCNLANTASTWVLILATLENLSWVDRQMYKMLGSAQERRGEQARAVAPASSPADPVVNTDGSGTTTTFTTARPGADSESTVDRQHGTTSQRHTDDDTAGSARPFDSDSEDDDEDGHDDNGRMMGTGSYQLHTSGNSGHSTTTPSTSAALNLVLDEVIMSSAILNPSGTDHRDSQSWHAGDEHSESVIYVHDEEDEGSAGQDAEGENSQEEGDEDEDEEELGDADDDEEEEVDEDDDENDVEDDGNEPETDEEVIGETGGVALVLRTGGSSRRRLRGSRRPINDGPVSIPVTGGRSSGNHEPTASAGEAMRVGFQIGTNDLALHEDNQEDSDGSYDEDEDDDLDPFGRDDTAGLDVLGRAPNIPVLLNSDGRLLREANLVGTVVEEVLNLFDTPHQVVSAVGGRPGLRRDRFVLTSSELTGLNVIPTTLGSNWGFFLPRLSTTVNANGHTRGTSTSTTNFPPNTTVFRFGLGGGAVTGGNMSVFVSGGNNGRFGNSINSVPFAGTNATGSSQPTVSASLPSQHPLLQVPSALVNTSQSMPTAPVNAAPSSSMRLNRTLVANAGTTPSRISSALPPLLPSSFGSGHPTRGRSAGTALGPILIGSRSRGPPSRLYVPVDSDTIEFRPPPPDVDAANTTSGSATPSITSNLDSLRDSRAGPESDSLVWALLSSITEDQPSSTNTALASAFFSQLDQATSRNDTNLATGLNSSQLSAYAGYALPAGFRRWVTLCRVLFGHELMDLILLSRQEIFAELARRRQELLNQRVAEAATAEAPTDEPAAPVAGSDAPEVPAATDLPVEPPLVPPEPSVSLQAETQPSTSEPATVTDPSVSSEQVPASSTIPEAEPSSQEPEPEPAASATTAEGPSTPFIPVTDEETIQSLIESGMDPSFLDALPEDVRREVMANHRHARRVQHQLSSLSLPEHVNAEWLAGLPPNIQEEVLLQFRNEQAAATSREGETASSTDPSRSGQQASSAQPENSTDFLSGLSTSLRREVLADIDESQLDMLPPDLAAEARQLRRENEERFARAVQGGMVSVTRGHSDRWHSLNTPGGLIGGPGRWDVRFNSINQLLRHLTSTIGAPSGSGALLLGGQNISTVRGRHLVDHDGLVCLIVLLIATSPYSNQRRLLIPTLKKVLRNLSCHLSTRHWIVGTLLSLYAGLSEKALCSKLSDMIESTEERGAESSIMVRSANNIFYKGFEAALGCWVRIFHPIYATKQEGESEAALGTTSKSCIQHHMIHPQAAVSVSSILLDTLDELAKAFPVHFYPRSSMDAKTEVEDKPLEWPRPAFWEIFERLSKSAPAIGSAGPSRGSRRSYPFGRKRQSSTSGRHPSDTSHQAGTSADPSGGTPMEVSHTDVALTTDSTGVHRRRSTSTVDYFVKLADLVCHPLLVNRPSHQERILSTLAGIMKEFVLSRVHPHTADNQARDPSGPSVTGTSQQPGTSASSLTAVTDSTAAVTPSPESLELMAPLRSEVVVTLCRFVWDPVTTEIGRELAAQLIADLAHANSRTKKHTLDLLAQAAVDLSTVLIDQLQQLSLELDERNVTHGSSSSSSTSHSSTLEAQSSSSHVTTSIPQLRPPAGRLLGVDSVTMRSGETRTSQSTNLSDLQLTSAQPFSRQNSCQVRFRGILGIIIRLAAGECSCNSTEAVPVSGDSPLQSLSSLDEFWSAVSTVFDKLQALNDPNAVLLIQPLLEAFCLVNLHLVKDSIRIRQRTTTSRSNRPTVSTSGTSHSLVEMVPLLQLRVEVEPSGDQTGTQQGEPNTHLQLDVMGPLSPPSVPTEEEEPQSTSAATSQQTNAILKFAERHKVGLNQVLRQSVTALGESPFAVFLVFPRVLDFDIKRRFFRQQLQSLSPRSHSSRYDDEPIVISRDRIFEDSYARLHRKSPADWKHKFVIRFQNEEGQDAGGPLREWYLLMSREIFNPNYCLFRTSPADRVTYTINPSSYINSNHLSYFKFVGRFIAKAIYDNKLLECYFSRSFYKHILGVPVKCSDLEGDDYEFYKGLEFLLTNHISALGYDLTFSTEINEFGKTETRDLVENGRNLQVTEQNKREYVRLVCQEKMTGAIRQQLDAFLSGFYEIVPKRMISIFNEQELELLISGLPNIDIADLKANTTYSKYQPTSPQIEWFWTALESFEQEDRARFLQFVTGTSKVPLGGFANLEGMHGPTKFQISRGSTSSVHHLPCAHTCFNTLVLPAYESYEQLRTRLLTAIRECSEGYGMA